MSMRKSHLISCRSFILIFGTTLLALGCGGNFGDVSGTVKYKGQPLKFGSVQIIASDGSTYGTRIEPDGSYSISRVPVGKGVILVSAVDEEKQRQYTKKLSDGVRNSLKSGKPPPQTSAPVNFSVIPSHYADFTKSGLEVEVKSGKTPHDIDLK